MCDDNNRRLPNATNGFISNSCRQMPNTTAYNGTAAVTSEGSMKIINQQCQEIYELRTQLNSVMSERDALLNEVGRLKFNMEFYDQRAARESKYDDSNNRRFFNRCQKYNHWADTVSKNSIGQPEPLHTSASYELSQDLIEMRIEIIEQKYGGSCASAAAIIIQRAFRHYMLLKKFAHITAIAKAEKILTKQLENTQSVRSHNNQTNQKSGTKPGCKTVRCNSLPRSKSGRCDLNYYYTLESCSHYCLHSCNYNDLKVNVNTMNMEIISEPFFCQEDISQVNNHNNMIPNFLSDNHSNDSDTYKQAHSGSDCNQYISSDGIFSTEGYVSNTTNTKIPPEVPKRTSSISFRSLREHQRNIASGALNQISNSDSLTSVQSSSSDCSISHSQNMNQTNSSVDSSILSNSIVSWSINSQVSDVIRKRQYRIGLNLFNKNPSKGIIYLVCRGFLDNTPHAVARFLISRKGISKKMIGEYLSDLQNSFNSAVLEYFAQEIDLSGMQVDMALRKFQTYFRMPGEAQKIEKIIEVFSHRYCLCNRDVVARLRNLDTVFILAFAIIMLNTDLHTPNMKPEQRMKMDDFIKNLRGVDNCEDIDRIMLVGIYERIKANEFKPGSDHVTQVLKVQSTIVGKKPNLALPHRRLVCYCRLYEVIDIYKKERPGVHQREVFLFNDLLVITKILCKKKNSVTYMFRQSYLLNGLTVSLFQMPHYQFGIKLIQRLDGNLLITFNARNDHDRCKFVEDIRESISEMDEMENLRIESEIQRYRHSHNNRSINSNSENRDSGVSDIDLGPLPMGSPKEQDSFRGNQATIKRPALTVT